MWRRRERRGRRRRRGRGRRRRRRKGEEDCWGNQPDLDLILDKKLLVTITENQNSPYSTQASHSKSRRQSAQSIFGPPDPSARRGSLPSREPTVLELFHENELEEDLNGRRVARSSRESGVGSLGGDSMEAAPEQGKVRLVVDLPVAQEEEAGCLFSGGYGGGRCYRGGGHALASL